MHTTNTTNFSKPDVETSDDFDLEAALSSLSLDLPTPVRTAGPAPRDFDHALSRFSEDASEGEVLESLSLQQVASLAHTVASVLTARHLAEPGGCAPGVPADKSLTQLVVSYRLGLSARESQKALWEREDTQAREQLISALHALAQQGLSLRSYLPTASFGRSPGA